MLVHATTNTLQIFPLYNVKTYIGELRFEKYKC